METLANKIASYLGKTLKKDDEQTAVMAYGLIAILQTISIFFFALIFGLVFKILPETMIVFFSVGFLRRLIGGHHSSKLYSCLIISVFCIVLFSFLTRYIIITYLSLPIIAVITVIIYLTAFALIYKLAPIDNPNKRVKTEEKRRRLRKNSFIVLLTFFVLSVTLIIFQHFFAGLYSRIVVSLALSVLWQVSMLTKAGGKLISSIDRLFIFC